MAGVTLEVSQTSSIHPLVFLFNLSMKTNQIPSQWKNALIIPIHKKGNRNVPSNYRPISLTSSFCRIFETIISHKIMQHLLANNLLTPLQFGFIPNKSSSSQLLTCFFDWLTAFANNLTTDIVYTDIAKAFDSVSHPKLFATLQSYGLNCEVLNWIESFLSDRYQQVVIKDAFSSSLKIFSGVPQGSVLGPLLFLIFINDIHECTLPLGDEGSISLFADDTKIYSTNSQKLQSSLNSVCEFFSTHQLKLAPSKCVVLHVSKPSKTSSNNQCFYLNDHQISSKPNFKDLGVYISEDLKWSHHISYIVRNASVSLYNILKCFKSNNIWTLLKLYKTYVRPKLEYATSVWSPYFKKDIAKIEGIQKRFTKSAFLRSRIPYTSYNDRLFKINLKSLEYRRIEFDIIMMYKIINGLSDIDFNNYFEFKEHSYNLRGNSRKIVSKFSFKSQPLLNCFFIRVIKYWNFLPENVAGAPNLFTFKRLVKSTDLTKLL